MLSGLSGAQNWWEFVAPDDEAAGSLPEWKLRPTGGIRDPVTPIHPVYAIPAHEVEVIQAFFASKEGF